MASSSSFILRRLVKVVFYLVLKYACMHVSLRHTHTDRQIDCTSKCDDGRKEQPTSMLLLNNMMVMVIVNLDSA